LIISKSSSLIVSSTPSCAARFFLRVWTEFSGLLLFSNVSVIFWQPSRLLFFVSLQWVRWTILSQTNLKVAFLIYKSQQAKYYFKAYPRFLHIKHGIRTDLIIVNNNTPVRNLNCSTITVRHLAINSQCIKDKMCWLKIVHSWPFLFSSINIIIN
jgi:hypothetical protein